jgi:hypothetical protein
VADSGTFGADPEELKKAGVDITKLAGINERIRHDLVVTLNAYQGRALGTGGDITESLLKNYVPGAKAGVEFLGQVASLLEGHGLLTHDVGNVTGGADDDATTITNGRK